MIEYKKANNYDVFQFYFYIIVRILHKYLVNLTIN